MAIDTKIALDNTVVVSKSKHQQILATRRRSSTSKTVSIKGSIPSALESGSSFKRRERYGRSVTHFLKSTT